MSFVSGRVKVQRVADRRLEANRWRKPHVCRCRPCGFTDTTRILENGQGSRAVWIHGIGSRHETGCLSSKNLRRPTTSLPRICSGHGQSQNLEPTTASADCQWHATY